MKQGQYIKESVFWFIVDNDLTPLFVQEFIEKLVKILKVKLVFSKVNKLPPGFDVFTGIQESCIYFGYWGEYKYCRLFISSCKNYDEEKVLEAIKKFFPVEGNVMKKTTKDLSIKKEVEVLQCLNKYLKT